MLSRGCAEVVPFLAIAIFYYSTKLLLELLRTRHLVLCCKSDYFDLVTFKYLSYNNYSGCDNIHGGITSLLGKCYI